MGTLFKRKHGSIYLLAILGIIQDTYGQLPQPSQPIDPYCINVTGSSIQVNDIYFDWSLGEAAMVHTLETQKNYILSTGFLQSVYTPLYLYNELDSFGIQIKVGPNPFKNSIIIQSKVDELTITSIQLINFQGKLLYNFEGLFSGLQFYHEIIIEKLVFPVCFLRIQYCIADKIYRSKYLKLLQN
jgi:hypothetical protein